MKKQSRRQNRYNNSNNNESITDAAIDSIPEEGSGAGGAPAEPEGEHIMSDVEIENIIQKREAELRANPKGLDVSTTFVKVGKKGEPVTLKEVPCLGKYWIKDVEKKPYVLPTVFKMPNFGKDRSGEVVFYKKHFRDYNETFHSLVTLQFKFFWSTVMYNDRIIPLIHSFLDSFPKPWSRGNTVFTEDDDVRELSEEFLSLVKQTLMRLATRRESASVFITPAGYTEIVTSRRMFTAPCIVSACAQYGASDPEFCTAIRSLVEDYENISTDSLEAGKAVLKDFESPYAAPELCAQFMQGNLKCVLDAAASVASVLRVCPAVTEVFYKNKLLVTIQEVYNAISGGVEDEDDDEEEEEEEENGNEEDEMRKHVLKCLIACAAHIMNGVFITKLRDCYKKMVMKGKDSKDNDTYDKLIGELIEVITSWSTAPSKKFIREFAKSTHLGKRVSRLANEFPNTIYIGKIVEVYTALLPYEEEAEAESLRSSTKSMPNNNSSSSGGDDKVDPLVAQICEIIGDADKEILKGALADNNYNVEVVIDKILNGVISVTPQQSQSQPSSSREEEEEEKKMKKKEKKKKKKGEVEVKVSDKKKTAEEMENENFERQALLKESIFTRLERMEEEEELEQIHRYEQSRLRKVDSSSVYDDEYDDSYDEFINYDFQQDGERFNDNQTEEAGPYTARSGLPQAAPPPPNPAATEAKPQRKSRQQRRRR